MNGRARTADGKPAVVLLSGGLDSAVTLAEACSRGFGVYALSIDYGQKNRHELNAARKISESLGAQKHLVLELGLSEIGRSALTSDMAVPKGEDADGDEIPITYVPARNTIFLSLALAWAETLESFHIFLGANAVDYSGYPDCRPEYIVAFENMANLATRAAVEKRGLFSIHAPLLRMSKAQIIVRGRDLGVDFSLTQSCYEPDADGAACGECESCRLRLKGFAEAGMIDPVRYTGS
jgi:7-cyano-7-deazaguanine synthase